MPSPRRGWWIALGTFGALLLLPLLAYLLVAALMPVAGGPPPERPLSVAGSARPPRAEPPLQAQDDQGARLLVGTVMDGEDVAVAGAKLRVSGLDSLAGRSDEAGHFSLTAAPLAPLELVVSAHGYAERRIAVAAGAAGDRTRVEVILEQHGEVNGVVVAPDGELAASAFVRCTDRPEDSGLAVGVDDDGRFTLPPAAVGCAAVAQHRNFADSAELVLRAGDDNRLVLSEAAKIAGGVVDESGAAVTRFIVSIETFRPADGGSRRRRGVSNRVDDAQGRFELSGLKAGRYVLAVSAIGRPPVHTDSIELASGEHLRGLRVVLPRGAIMSGFVVDSISGDPVVGARVVLDAATLARTDAIARATTEVDGRYQLDGVPTGPFSVRASASGYVGRVIAGITSEVGGEVKHDIELEPAGDDERRTEYMGIGAMLAPSPEGILIGQVIEGGPGEAAGLLARDLILQIDGRSAVDITVAQAVQLLRGPAGTRVAVSVRRQDGAEHELVITRERFVR